MENCKLKQYFYLILITLTVIISFTFYYSKKSSYKTEIIPEQPVTEDDAAIITNKLTLKELAPQKIKGYNNSCWPYLSLDTSHV